MQCPRRDSQQTCDEGTTTACSSEPASPGQPIMADGMHTEVAVQPSLAYFPRPARRYGARSPADLHSYAKAIRGSEPSMAALRPTAAMSLSPPLYTPALRADLAPLANLATVRLRTPAATAARPCACAAHGRPNTRPRPWRSK